MVRFSIDTPVVPPHLRINNSFIYIFIFPPREEFLCGRIKCKHGVIVCLKHVFPYLDLGMFRIWSLIRYMTEVIRNSDKGNKLALFSTTKHRLYVFHFHFIEFWLQFIFMCSNHKIFPLIRQNHFFLFIISLENLSSYILMIKCFVYMIE